MHLSTSIFSGFSISFLGGLPLGNLNITAARIGSAGNLRKAYQFSTGVALVEMLYMIFCIQGVSLAHRYSAIFMVLRWFVVFLLFAIAIHCFISVLHKRKQAKRHASRHTSSNSFLLGLALSAANIFQIPFWAGWITLAMQNNWVGSDYTAYTFILAAGLGTFLCLMVYIIVGKKLSTWFTKEKNTIDLLLGALLLIVAFVQLYLILKPIM